MNNINEVKEQKSLYDHRHIGKELDLFSFDEYVGSGLVLWHPKGAIIRQEIEDFWKKEHRIAGYQYVYSPVIGLKQLWEKSGHLDHFQDCMYPPMDMGLKDKQEQGAYFVKPMSCPFHVRIYNSMPRSYKDLPIRYCELGNVYRYEASGGLQGLLRVRSITQDDAHIICRKDQFMKELSSVFDFGIQLNKAFGYDKFKVYFSVRDMKNNKDKYIQNEEVWEFAEKSIEKVLKQKKIPYDIDVGGAKFYGPAIDIKAIDSNNKEWQCMTIQLDMNLPQKWGMSYVGKDGKKHIPIMLHRAILGSIERFIGVYLEHMKGLLPVWLSPVQVKILPVSSKHHKIAQKIAKRLLKNEIRAEVDLDNDTIGYQIRKFQFQKIPYAIIIGDKELENNSISIRKRNGELINNISIADFLKLIKKKIKQKSLDI